MIFYPEGTKISKAPSNITELMQTMHTKQIVEAVAISCDSSRNLHFNLGEINAIMPKEECTYNAKESDVRDIAILSRVGRKTCFIIKDIVFDDNDVYALISRKEAQIQCMEEYINAINIGDVISAKVTHLENFGAFCDIGCGIIALLPIDCMSVSRISSAADRFYQGQEIYCIVKNKDIFGRLVLSTKELFGTWTQNAANYHIGQSVIGIVRSIETYGVFIELAPNLTGLAENTIDVKCGQCVSVFIKNIQEEKMKIKLSILQKVDDVPTKHYTYSQTSGHVHKWVYSTQNSTKFMQTVFDENTINDYNDTIL